MKILPRIRISVHTAVFVLTLLILDRSFMSFIPLAAALCHELGHIVLIYAIGTDVDNIEITLFGAEIRSGMGSSSHLCRIAVYAAGGMANLLSAWTVSVFSDSIPAEFFMGCSVALALFNFLPIRTLDGGCIAEELLSHAFPNRAEQIFSALSAVTLSVLWLFSVFLLLVAGGNISLLLFCAYMFYTLYFKQEYGK